MQKLLLFLLLIGTISGWSQETDTNSKKKHILKGIIIDGDTKKSLVNTHIINLNTVTGNVSGSDGRFKTRVQVNDTLYF